ncbi:hypothetical protein C8R47DRAFT_538198, partial [Mycena vitilis]
VIAADPSEPGYDWENNEDQRSRNDFSNDSAYIGARFLLRLVQAQGLVPAYVVKVTHTVTRAMHIVVLFADGRYMCDCCMGSNLGCVCRHFLVVWLKIPGLPFHISLIRARWLAEPGLDVKLIEAVTFAQGVSNHTIRFSAMTLPMASISNPVSTLSLHQPPAGGAGASGTPGPHQENVLQLAGLAELAQLALLAPARQNLCQNQILLMVVIGSSGYSFELRLRA